MTDDELAAIRAEIGDATPPTDVEIEAIFDRKGSPSGSWLSMWQPAQEIGVSPAPPGRVSPGGRKAAVPVR